PAPIGQGRKLRVGATIDPLLQRFATGATERRLLQLAIFERDNAPAARLENIVEAPEHAIRRRRVEALAVIVDDPPAIAQVVLIAFNKALIDIAFVEFGVTHERDHASHLILSQLAVRDEI